MHPHKVKDAGQYRQRHTHKVKDAGQYRRRHTHKVKDAGQYRRRHTHKVSWSKSIIWRLLGVAVLWTISYIFTGSIPASTMITLVHHITFLIVYYLHERAWLKTTWSYESHHRSFLKGFIYEIVIAIPVLSLISFLFTGNLTAAVSISVFYTTLKLILYYLFERAFLKCWHMDTTNYDKANRKLPSLHMQATAGKANYDTTNRKLPGLCRGNNRTRPVTRAIVYLTLAYLAATYALINNFPWRSLILAAISIMYINNALKTTIRC